MESTVSKKRLSIIIKSTYDCNMGCSYCYEGTKPPRMRMTLDIVKTLLARIENYFPPDSIVDLTWHGGEPLIMGIDFYRSILDLQGQIPLNFHNSLQTNGLLLTNEFADFLSQNKFRVGLSIDGPSIIHDAQRKNVAGKPTFTQVFSAVERIRKCKLSGKDNHVSALAVFTKTTYEHLDSFYRFFRDNQINVQINPLLISGNAKSQSGKELAISPTEYGKSLVQLFEWWVSEPEYSFSIEPFEGILRQFVTGKPSSCTFSGNCYDRYLSISPDGDVIPCGRWSKNEYCYGNIKTDDFETILKSQTLLKFKKAREITLSECQQCQYFEYCHGGCPFSGFMKRGEYSDKDFYCESYKMLFRYIESYINSQVMSVSALKCV